MQKVTPIGVLNVHPGLIHPTRRHRSMSREEFKARLKEAGEDVHVEITEPFVPLSWMVNGLLVELRGEVEGESVITGLRLLPKSSINDESYNYTVEYYLDDKGRLHELPSLSIENVRVVEDQRYSDVMRDAWKRLALRAMGLYPRIVPIDDPIVVVPELPFGIGKGVTYVAYLTQLMIEHQRFTDLMTGLKNEFLGPLFSDTNTAVAGTPGHGLKLHELADPEHSRS